MSSCASWGDAHATRHSDAQAAEEALAAATAIEEAEEKESAKADALRGRLRCLMSIAQDVAAKESGARRDRLRELVDLAQGAAAGEVQAAEQMRAEALLDEQERAKSAAVRARLHDLMGMAQATAAASGGVGTTARDYRGQRGGHRGGGGTAEAKAKADAAQAVRLRMQSLVGLAREMASRSGAKRGRLESW